MKQGFKKLLFLLFLMSFFTSSKEKTCVENTKKCLAVSVVAESNAAYNSDADADSDLSIMPISQFIIVQ